MSTSSLKNRALNGVFWSAIDRFSSQGISFLISIVIARLLTPHDYGLVAMVGIFISIAQAFIDSGLSSALSGKKTGQQLTYLQPFMPILSSAYCVMRFYILQLLI